MKQLSFSSSLLSRLLIIAAILLRVASEPSANVSYVVLAAYALLGRSHAVQALALSWLFSMLSPGIGAEATYAAMGRYAVIAGAATSVLIRSMSPSTVRINKMVLATVLLGIGICVHALLFSSMKDISLLKAVSWTVACSTLIAAWSGLSAEARRSLERQIFYGLVVLMLVSLPLLVSGPGYLRNGTGFQGVLNHPQAFGPTMAVLAAWVMGRILTNERPGYLLMGLFGICLVLIVLSEARTAGLALLLALLLAGGVIQALTRKRLVVLFPALKSRRLHLAFALALGGMLMAAPMLGGLLQDYIAKRGNTTNIADVYDRSRGRLIEQMWINIKQQPWTGIGFGIASDPASMEVSRDPLLGLPVGASIEKGVLPLAVLEELGIPGALAVLAWIWMLIRRSIRGLSMVPLALLFTALLLNMGEMMLFSPGGMGLLMLLLVGFAASERPPGQLPASTVHTHG